MNFIELREKTRTKELHSMIASSQLSNLTAQPFKNLATYQLSNFQFWQVSISFYQFHFINFILSKSFYQFHFINFISKLYLIHFSSHIKQIQQTFTSCQSPKKQDLWILRFKNRVTCRNRHTCFYFLSIHVFTVEIQFDLNQSQGCTNYQGLTFAISYVFMSSKVQLF